MGAEVLDRAYTATAAVLANVAPEQLDLSTPCSSWTVRDLLNHVIAGGYFFAAVASGHEPTPAGTWRGRPGSPRISILTPGSSCSSSRTG